MAFGFDGMSGWMVGWVYCIHVWDKRGRISIRDGIIMKSCVDRSIEACQKENGTRKANEWKYAR